MKLTLRDIDVTNKRILHHCDFNIKLKLNEKEELIPVSDMRLKAYFPSIFFIFWKNKQKLFLSLI